jgi:hypothetical protein
MALTQVSKDVLNNSQANITQVGTLANLTVSGNISTSSNVKFTNWAMYETSDTLYFTHNGEIKMSINSNGNLTVTGDVTGFGTP